MSTDQLTLPEGVIVDEWMFDVVRPFIKGRTLEIGSGNDAITSCFLKNNLPIHLSDTDREGCEVLIQKYEGNPLVRSIHRVNLHRSDFFSAYSDRIAIFDTVFKLNSSNQIPINSTAISNANLLLKPGGHLIVLLPAYTALYTGMEEDPKAIKRHNRQFVRSLLGQSFEVQQTQYFNLPGSGLSVIVIASKS
jgi:tRNA1(Val) A37 N6-methylase TrmN6